MASFVFRNMVYASAAALIKPYFLCIKPFSSSSSSSPSPLKSIEKYSNGSSFVVDYLINSCAFSPEKAISASKYVKFKTPDKPDSVLSFLRKYGLTKAQIWYLTNNCPPVLLCSPEKTLLPKLEFLKSKGASRSDIATIVCLTPAILKRSLGKQLIPSFNFYNDLLRSELKTVAAIKRFSRLLLFDPDTYMVPNIELLMASGVPVRNVEYLLKYNPRSLITTCDKFKQVVEEVKKLGFDSLKLMFLLAIYALKSMKKPTWERKIEVYKKWGWSDDDIVAAFRKNIRCMVLSEDKTNLMMDFWVNKMGWEPSILANRPARIAYSLEKRIIPRCEVYKALVSKGLINREGDSLGKLLSLLKSCFYKNSSTVTRVKHLSF